MSPAILKQIVNQLEMLEFFELQQLDRAIGKYLAQKQQATQQYLVQKSANKKQLFREWDDISDEEAAVLKAEFAAEDLAFAQVALSDYLPRLHRIKSDARRYLFGRFESFSLVQNKQELDQSLLYSEIH